MDIRKVTPEAYRDWLIEQGPPTSEAPARMAKDALLGMLAQAKENGVSAGYDQLFLDAEKAFSEDYQHGIRSGST